MDTNDTDVAGVAYIQYFLSKEFGWTLRNRYPVDCGIDADVEIKTNRKYTGKHIALQIKSGKSYQKIKTNNKITFLIDDWHFRYWMTSDRPVLLLFIDPDDKQIIWEQVKQTSIINTKKNRKIEIYPNKILTNEIKNELEDIVTNYVPAILLDYDQSNLSYEESILCFREANRSAKDVNRCFSQFREELQTQIKKPNPITLSRVLYTSQKRLISASKLFIENYFIACHYFIKLLSISPVMPMNETLDTNIEIMEQNILVWKTNINELKRFNHPNFPEEVKRAGNSFIESIENYIYELESIKSFLLTLK
ncbi:DUF4365 domain-containing protein [Bacteroides sp.]|uniref:DUF4365 domain-containing protein n=1 Tax=Bacteroides sp. TaxID=29523 RepID=UPI002610E502|nr:DUF4365 domain-containing protein [Bacteroides sp.]